MKTEIKKRTVGANYLLIVYPDGVPSSGFDMRKQDLYELYVQLRDMFSVPVIEEDEEEDTTTLGLSLDE